MTPGSDNKGDTMETTKSADGTVIAYDRTGDGPPLIVAVGAFGDRRAFVPPGGLTGGVPVCTSHRRGRGGSGDTHAAPPRPPGGEPAAWCAGAGVGGGVAGGPC